MARRRRRPGRCAHAGDRAKRAANLAQGKRFNAARAHAAIGLYKPITWWFYLATSGLNGTGRHSEEERNDVQFHD